MRRKQRSDDPIDIIRREFRELYADWELELPKRLEPKGVLHEAGWSITYVLNEDDAGAPVLDLLAEHRMTNMQHTRITAGGDVIGLPTFMDAVPFDPSIDEDEDAGRRRYDEHNEAVTEQLRASGLI